MIQTALPTLATTDEGQWTGSASQKGNIVFNSSYFKFTGHPQGGGGTEMRATSNLSSPFSSPSKR